MYYIQSSIPEKIKIILSQNFSQKRLLKNVKQWLQQSVLSSSVANPTPNLAHFIPTFASPNLCCFIIWQLCFSYKGKMKDYISFRISYTDKSSADRRSWRKYSIVTIPDEKWNSLCMNVYDQILHDAYIKADLRYKVHVDIISVTRDAGVDLYIDDIFIWRESVMGRF